MLDIVVTGLLVLMVVLNELLLLVVAVVGLVLVVVFVEDIPVFAVTGTLTIIHEIPWLVKFLY